MKKESGKGEERGDQAMLERLLAGDRRTLAKTISMVEREPASAGALLARLHGSAARAWRIGVTGPPGVGKSMLTAALTRHLVENGRSVGIIAVDPSSPYTRGAVLGDRVRMAGIDAGERVFIRSMATRGIGGGLSAAAMDAADLVAAAGFDYVIVESAGVGQVELDIRQLVDTALVVLVPESGDEVQAVKAGLMEIADLYIMNKADRPGSITALNTLRTSLSHQHGRGDGWTARVMRAVATSGEGVAEINAAIDEHRNVVSQSGVLEQRRAEGVRIRLRRLVERVLVERLWDPERRAYADEMAPWIMAGETDIRAVVDEVLRRFAGSARHGEEDGDQRL